MIDAIVVADSISTANVRITTFELTLPKWLLAEVNTYRNQIARNSASSRAVPTLRYVQQVEEDPFIFKEWKYRAPEGGMVPGGPMREEDALRATEIWLEMRDAVTKGVRKLELMKGAKEQINRALEPWMWTKTVLTTTDLDNLFTQRLAGDAQGEFQQLARAMKDAYHASKPRLVHPTPPGNPNGWHLPYITDEERLGHPSARTLAARSATRCARVSYLRQGQIKDETDELLRCDQLIADRHWSPLEMPCLALDSDRWCGPFRGWKSFRKFFGGESGSLHSGTRSTEYWALGG